VRTIIFIFYLIPIITLSQSNNVNKLAFDTDADTLSSYFDEKSKKLIYEIGQIRYLNGGFENDSSTLTLKKISPKAPEIIFGNDGKLIVYGCYVECGKYICESHGTWTLIDKILKLNIYNIDAPDHIFSFSYGIEQINNDTFSLNKIH